MLESCRLRLNTPNGEGELSKISLSELGYLMVKVENGDKTFTSYNLGKPKDNLSIDDLIIHLTKNND
jgi:hypothetical protein